MVTEPIDHLHRTTQRGGVHLRNDLRHLIAAFHLMPIAIQSMSSRLESKSAVLGQYMLQGWTLTDLQCDECGVTPLMREPSGAAQRAGRAAIQFCALCDGGPEAPNRARANEPAPSTYATASATPEPLPAPSTPARAAPSSSSAVSPPPLANAAAKRADPEAAADAIAALLLQGYSLLSAACPDPACAGVPLVGFPRRKDGTKDPRRECVSCGKRWINERDLAESGLRIQQEAAASSSATTLTPAMGQATIVSATVPSNVPTTRPAEDEPESPRTRARKDLYAQGEVIMKERRAAEAKKAAEAAEAAAGPSRGYAVPSAGEPSSAPASALGLVSAKAADEDDDFEMADDTPAAARKPFASADHRPEHADGRFRVVLVSTGSVASVKIPLIVEALKKDPNVDVQVVATRPSLHFYDRAAVEASNPGVRVWTDEDEWSDWKKIGDPILHIELRRWADLVVVAPTSADILAKIAGGLSDNLVLSMLRALAPETPVILAPAMNTFMYEHPLTARHEAFIREVLGYYILGPQGAGKLACGDAGAGKMTDWKDIVSVILSYAAVFLNRSNQSDTTLLKSLLTSMTNPAPSALLQPVVTPAAPIAARNFVVPPAQPVLVHPQPRPAAQQSVTRPIPKLRNRFPVRDLKRPLSGTTPKRPKSTAERSPLHFLRFLLYPFLVLLHVAFTLSSIVLRIFQANPTPPDELTKDPPQHAALIFVPGATKSAESRRLVAERYIESVRRAVQWAGEWGVGTISVWDGEGLGIKHHSVITTSLLHLPPSPPSSTPPSPPLGIEEIEDLGENTVKAAVYVDTDAGSRRVEILFLAPSATDTLTRVTRQYARGGVAPSDVTQVHLDHDVKADLGLPSDPDLVIIHHLSPPGFIRGLLPRPAPELWGYPAWTLRLSEIYTHPPTLPLYLMTLGELLQNSPLPVLRKLGTLFPSADSKGVLSVDAWEGAQGAWEKVEQRRGK
ncbi:hypothetical protein Q8F55_005509 [Vanrija albida]|uniref:Flavoprotein domain-containing protein n=1 Tax=Vanrija albida TaxID=181172 RepID=A0ABR3Q218_9TREE